MAAHGQAFPAIASVVQGSAEITRGPRTTDIAVFSPQVVINWTLDDLVYVTTTFQNLTPNLEVPFFTFAGRAGSGGNVVPFNPGGPVFAPGGVTNFLPRDAVATFTGNGSAFSGYTVLNRLLLPGAAVFNGTVQSFVGNNPGGNIWFYNPHGILVGTGAVFNVGSLVLTTNDIETEGGLFGPGNAIRFRGIPSSTAAIEIRPGAQLNALAANGAYLAVVAPRVVQAGALRSNGSVALVAAEQADIRINAGLLDIVVTEGTSDLNGIVHAGTTGGPVSGNPQAIAMVAVPKNEAITMLLTGAIGYQPAAQVTTEGTSVVLSSGAASASAPSQGDGSILVGNTTFTSPVDAYASNAIEIAPAAGGLTDFRSNASLSAGHAVRLTAVANSRIAGGPSLAIAAGANGTGGAASLNALGGTISAGQLTIDASGFGFDGTGGTVAVSASNGGTIEALELTAIADGVGGEGDLVGGNGIGGSVTIRDAGGRLDLGSVSVSARGIAGGGVVGDGSAVGGSALIEILSQPQEWGDLAIDASASGAANPDGSNAFTGGTIAVTIDQASAFSLASDFSARAGGDIAPSGPGFSLQASGTAFSIGGSAEIDTAGDVALTLDAGGVLETGAALSIATPRSVTSTGLVDAGGPVSITGGLGIGMTELRSGGTTFLSAPSGPLSISQDLRSIGPVTARAQSVDLVSTGSLAFTAAEASAGGLSIQASGNLDLASANAAGDVLLGAGGDIRVGQVTGNGVLLTAGSDIVADGELAASGALQFQAGDLVAVNARAAGSTISVGSSDIAIGGGGQLGARGTTRSILLSNIQSGNRTLIGGIGQAGAYSLDAGEAGRLFADQAITVTALLPDQPSAIPADFIVGDLAMSFGPSGNLGAGGRLQLQTAGRVEVGGAARLTTVGGSDTLAIAADRVDINPASGSLAMRSAAGALQGRLELTADTVAAANPSTIALIDADVIPVAINVLLDMPAAAPSDLGYLQAGEINVSIADAFFIQNSGTKLAFSARRGFSANSLSIATRSAAALIVINGQTFDAQGVAITGLATAQTVRINGLPATGRGQFHPFSSINGCFIGRNCRILPADVIPPRSNMEGPIEIKRNLDIVRGDLVESLSRQDGISVLDRNEALTVDDLVIPLEFQVLPYLLFFDQPDPARQQPLLDEPVTGVGNDDLWQGNCLPGSTDCPEE